MKKTNVFLAALFEEKALKMYLSLHLKEDFDLIKSLTSKIDLHLTIGYMRGVNIQDLALIASIFEPLIHTPMIKTHVQQLITLGNGHRANCILAALLEDSDGSFRKLHDQALTLLRKETPYTFENSERFLSHVTIGRLNHHSAQRERMAFIEKFKKQPIPNVSINVERLGLMQRNLVTGHYDCLKSYHLGQ